MNISIKLKNNILYNMLLIFQLCYKITLIKNVLIIGGYMNKRWEAYKLSNEDSELVSEIAQKFKISPLFATVLINRGIKEEEQINRFLHPNLDDLNDPFLFKDMDKATERIIKAINDKEKITIYGDYDVDGITSTTILYKFLKKLNNNIDYYLPNRLTEGYGLSKDSILKIKEEGTSLLITVDCGISGYDEVEYAKELGMDVIITDHHECPEQIPKCIAVIDAKRKDNTYPFEALAGCGVAFKLIHALCILYKMPKEEYLKYLDIVALGTVADIVPLIDENRVIVKFGLEAMKKTENYGLRALINSSGVKNLESYSISFGLAPRINACGRMGEAELALKMLLTDEYKVAAEIAEKLSLMNRERQEIEHNIWQEAVAQIEEDEKIKNSKIIVVGKENWHHGVIGIVSSKITESYYKPSILVCFEGNEGKGSGRSVEGFDLHEALTKCKDYLEKFGGHEMAIGLTLKKENFESLRYALAEYAENKLPEAPMPVIKYDAEITNKDVTINTVNELKMLEPYGESNPPPLFAYKNVKVDSIRTLSNDKHLKLNIKESHRIFSAIAFNMGNLKNSIRMGDKADILCTIEINSYNGFDMLQLNIKDIKKSL